jgi:hypothetical protein
LSRVAAIPIGLAILPPSERQRYWTSGQYGQSVESAQDSLNRWPVGLGETPFEAFEPGGKGMSALVTVEDADTFNAPLTRRGDGSSSMARYWRPSAPQTTAVSLFPQLETKTPQF